MKVLLDECVPRKLKDHIVGHECHTVPQAGLAGKKNGELLVLAEKTGFEIFLTVDRGIAQSQNLHLETMAIVVIRSKSNRLADLSDHIPDLLRVPESIEPGQLIRMSLIR